MLRIRLFFRKILRYLSCFYHANCLWVGPCSLHMEWNLACATCHAGHWNCERRAPVDKRVQPLPINKKRVAADPGIDSTTH